MTSAPRARAAKATTTPVRRRLRAVSTTGRTAGTVIALPPAPSKGAQAEEFDALAAISALPENYRECRDRRHPWRDYDVRHDAAKHLWEVWLRCPKCKTIRIRLIGEQGQYIGNSYDYPPGYVVKGIGHMNETGRDMLRLQALQDMQVRLAAKAVRK